MSSRRPKKHTIAHLTIFALTMAIGVYIYSPVQGATFDPAEITVPTRTPTPDPSNNGGGDDGGSDDNDNGGGDDDNDSGGGDDNNNGGGNDSGSGGGATQPTSTPIPTAVPVNIAPTPIDGYLDTTECGSPIFIAIFGDTNVRSQPDSASSVVAGLVYLEGRPIVARAADTKWWQISLSTGQIGWVADEVGLIEGNIAGVPALGANGQTVAAPGWNPPLNPNCSGAPAPVVSVPSPTTAAVAQVNTPVPVPPTATPPPPVDSTTAESEAIVAPEVESDAPESVELDQEQTDEEIVILVPTLEQTESAYPSSEEAEAVVPSLTPQAAVTEIAAISSSNNSDSGLSSSESLSESTLSETPSTTNSSTRWIILAGLGFIIVGIVSMVIQRRPS